MKKVNAILAMLLTVTMVVSVFGQTRGNVKVAAGAASATGTAAPAEILIKNATIMTASHGTINNGSILIRDGKIAEVGPNVKARDPNARIIDATGKYVIPGIIDCHSHTGVDGNVNEGSLSVTSMVRVRDVLDPTDVNIYRDRPDIGSAPNPQGLNRGIDWAGDPQRTAGDATAPGADLGAYDHRCPERSSGYMAAQILRNRFDSTHQPTCRRVG